MNKSSNIPKSGLSIFQEMAQKKENAKKYIFGLIDNNFDEYFQKLGFKPGFDLFKVRQMIFDDIAGFIDGYIFRKYSGPMNGIYLFNTYSGSWDSVCRRVEFALGWVVPEENIDAKIRYSLLETRRQTLKGRVFSLINKDVQITQDEIRKGREETVITGGYELSELGEQIIKGYFEAIGVNPIELLKRRTSLMSDSVFDFPRKGANNGVVPDSDFSHAQPEAI